MKKRTLFLILLSAAALTMALPAFAFASDHYSVSSRLASGKWVKVCVDTTGVYEISFEQLQAYGFDNPEAVSVYGYGGIAAADHTFSIGFPDDIQPTPSIHYNGRLLFYGEGSERASVHVPSSASFTARTEAVFESNTYSSGACYLLSDVEPWKETTPTPVPMLGDNPLGWHYGIALVDHDVQNPAKGGNIFHDRQLKAGESCSYELPLVDFCADVSPVGSLHIRAAAKSSSRSSIGLEFDGSVTSDISEITIGASSSKNRVFTPAVAAGIFTPADVGGDTQLGITLRVPSSFQGSYCAVDKVYVIYPRLNRMPSSGELFLNLASANKGQVAVCGVSGNIEVWDVTDPTAIVRKGLKYNNGTAVADVEPCDAYAGRRLVAFNPASVHRAPRFVGEVDNQNIHAASTPDMLIITTATLANAASELAAIHSEFQGMSVLVVEQENAYNEFGGGTRSVAALRRMVKMFADRQPGTLKYLLLYGPSSYDNRGLSVKGDFLACYECETADQAADISTNYVGDIYFGILSDDFVPADVCASKSDIAVGRIPAPDAGVAADVNAKIRNYLVTPPSAAAYNHLLKFSDDGDNQAHYKNSELFVKALVNALPAMTVSRADNMLFPINDHERAEEARRHLFNCLAREQGLLFYSGHGQAISLCGEIDFNLADVASLQNGVVPLVILSTCDSYPFDHQPFNVATAMLYNKDAGAMGVIGSSRTVYLEHNHTLSMALAAEYGKAEDGDTGADIFMRARNKLIDSGVSLSLACNTMCYNYCGDPALPLTPPSYKVTVDAGKDEITPGQRHCVKASVKDASGRVVKSFDGLAKIEIYDVPQKKDLIIRTKYDGAPGSVLADEMLLAEYSAEFKGGQLSADIVLPPGNGAAGTGRIVISARGSDGKYAVGLCKGVKFGDLATLDNTPPSDAPQIKEFYIDPADYAGGDNVLPSFSVRARVRPAVAGLATGFSTVRTTSALILDGNRPYPEALQRIEYDKDGMACINYKMGPLSPGLHKLCLRVVDNLGAVAEQTLSFIVNANPTVGKLSIAGMGSVCRSEAVFELEDAGLSKGHLLVTDLYGRTVFSKRDCVFPFVWNLRDADKRRIADGHYSAWAIIDSGNTRSSTPRLTFTVIE